MVPFPPATAVWVDALATRVFVPSETPLSTDDSGTIYGGMLIDSESEAHDGISLNGNYQYVVSTLSSQNEGLTVNPTPFSSPPPLSPLRSDSSLSK